MILTEEEEQCSSSYITMKCFPTKFVFDSWVALGLLLFYLNEILDFIAILRYKYDHEELEI